ncbi:MAG: hypothetical protein ACO3CH_00400 [Ilumatobacteraceae bacterium]|nr:hypothetical protein [Chitinophagales bacterium]
MTDVATKSTTVTLLPYEYSTASSVGARRVATAIYRNSANQHGFSKGHGWEEHIEGACAEMAVAKYLDIYWDGSNGTYKLPDLSGLMQVRWTPYETGKLIVRPADDDYCRYVLVTGRCPDYTIRGYMQGVVAKDPKYLDTLGDKSRPQVYAIPQSQLLDIREIC